MLEGWTSLENIISKIPSETIDVIVDVILITVNIMQFWNELLPIAIIDCGINIYWKYCENVGFFILFNNLNIHLL